MELCGRASPPPTLAYCRYLMRQLHNFGLLRVYLFKELRSVPVICQVVFRLFSLQLVQFKVHGVVVLLHLIIAFFQFLDSL